MIMNLVAFGLGMFIGLVVFNLLQRPSGTFLIDDSNEEKTKWTLRIDGDPDDIQKMKHVKFKVHIEN